MVSCTRSFAQQWQWARSSGGDAYGGGIRFNSGTSICTNNFGDVYAVGYFSGRAVYGKDTFWSYNNLNTVLIKYDSLGSIVWAKQLTFGGSDFAYGICLDRWQNVCIAGDKSGSAIRSFTVKYSPDGKLLWVNNATGEGCHSTTRAITTDAAGNIYEVGDCQGIISFDSFIIGAEKKYTVFLTKFSPDGKVLWVRHTEPANDYYNQGYGVALDKSEHIYIIAEYTDTAKFDKITVVSNGESDVVIAKFNKSGKIQWVKSFGSRGKDRPGNIAFDKNDNIYLTAYFSAPWPIKGKNITGDNLIKLSANGGFLWNKQIGVGAKEFYIRSFVTTDRQDNIYLAGYYYDAVPLLGEAKGSNNGGSDVFVAKLNASGGKVWKMNFGSDYIDNVEAICLDKNKNIYITGTFNKKLELGRDTLVSYNNGDGMYVGKIK